jgi:hypothetical protein
VHKESVTGKEASQSRQNLGQPCGDRDQDQAKAREPAGEQGVPQPGQQGKDSKRETEKLKQSAFIRAPRGLAGGRKDVRKHGWT